MEPLGDDSREHVRASTPGGVAQRWIPGCSAQCRPQAQQSVAHHWRKQSKAEAKALQQLCRTAFACTTDAQQALTTLVPGWQAASVPQGTISPRPRSRRWGRPGPDTALVQVVSQITGGLPSSLAAHEALSAPLRCCIRVTTELDTPR
jgi:hypothetical protein